MYIYNYIYGSLPNEGDNGHLERFSKNKNTVSPPTFSSHFLKKKHYFSDRFSHRFCTKTQQLKDNAKPTQNDSQKISFSVDYHRFSNSLLKPFLQPFLRPPAISKYFLGWELLSPFLHQIILTYCFCFAVANCTFLQILAPPSFGRLPYCSMYMSAHIYLFQCAYYLI